MGYWRLGRCSGGSLAVSAAGVFLSRVRVFANTGLTFYSSSSSLSTSSSLSLSTTSITTSVNMPTVESLTTEWPANKVRETFINFFEGKNHNRWISSPVVPVNDPTLLFANAGSSHLISLFLSLSLFDLYREILEGRKYEQRNKAIKSGNVIKMK